MKKIILLILIIVLFSFVINIYRGKTTQMNFPCWGFDEERFLPDKCIRTNYYGIQFNKEYKLCKQLCDEEKLDMGYTSINTRTNRKFCHCTVPNMNSKTIMYMSLYDYTEAEI